MMNKVFKSPEKALEDIRDNKGAINAIFTNLAYIEVKNEGLFLKEVAPGVTPEEVQNYTEPCLIITSELKEMVL